MKRPLSVLVLVWLSFAFLSFAAAGPSSSKPQPTPPSEPPIVEVSDTLEHQLQGAIQPSAPLGYLPTNSEVVVQRGEYALTVPIVVPPGVAGAQPSLDVHYSSAGGNGLLGVGAALGGFSEIRRCGQTFAVDFKVSPANFSMDSRFCLDSQPLIVVKGDHGDVGSEYRVERDGFDKIEYVGTSFFEPGLFTVHTKDGRILRYEAIKVVRAEPQPNPPYTLQPTENVDAVFPLREVSDRAGNRVVYEYEEDTAVAAPEFFALEYYPTSIKYTLANGDSAFDAKRAVQFVYEDRPDPSFSFLAGVRLKNTKRLKAIELYAPNPTAREKVGSYHFTYGLSAATQRSLLTSVTRCDAKDVCQWGKKFVWETSARPDFEQVEVGDPEFTVNEFIGSHDTGLLVYDMDGDGADEVLYRHESEFYFRKKSATGVPLGDRFYIDPVISAAGSPVGFGCIRLDQSRPVDIDGDGDTELFAAQIPELGYHIFEWNPDAGGVASTGLLFDAPLVQEGNGDPHLGTIAFGDTTGQGLPDVFYQYYLSPKQPRWGIVKNAGGGAFDDGTDTDVPAYCARAARVLDRDGDGRAEVWNAGNLACTESIVTAFDAGGKFTSDDQPGLHYDAKRTIFTDLNGDGLRDLVRPATHGDGWVRWNTGVDFGSSYATSELAIVLQGC